jgi:hypothetical protein
MLPVFRSMASVTSFCVLLIVLLCLPLVTYWLGHPSREQAYAGITTEAGPIGTHVREMFQDPANADVLFLGSSLVRAGIDEPEVEEALSSHLGRPAHVEILALNWQGLDLQYFMLRDYLSNHHPGIVVWNLPVPGSRNLEPHVEAFRWIRFGEYSDALSGLPLRYRLALYSDMILGAPRELLSHLRPNLLSNKEVAYQISSEKAGYYGAVFVPEPGNLATIPTIEQSYENSPYSLVHVTGKPLNPYENHFAMKILELAKQSHTRIVLLHIPIDSEEGLGYLPERGRWDLTLHTGAPMIGAPSDIIFSKIDKAHFHDYYRDQHLNFNGSMIFTQSILPALLKAYDERAAKNE